MNRRCISLVLVFMSICLFSVTAEIPGTGLGITFEAGLMGSLSYFEAGLLLPKINDTVFINIKARACSAITWTTFVNMETDETVSFHPVVVGGVVSVGSVGPFNDQPLRMYGGSDFFLGYSFTPYDSLYYDVGNLIGPNLTFAITGYFGFEYFTSEKSSFHIEAGGGFKSLFVEDKEQPYAVASSWLGSGFGIQMGSRIYF